METQERNGNGPGPRGPGGTAAAGFTLIELLTVVAIIGLLVGMIVPTIQSVLDALYAARTLARIDNLGNGAKMYKIEGTGNKYFPVQQYAQNILVSSGTLGMGNTANYVHAGGAALARVLFTKPDPNSTPASVKADLFPVGNWSVLESDLLDPPDSTNSAIGRDTPKPYSILDCSSHPLAILYFPSRLESLGSLYQYTKEDNNVYVPDNTYLATRGSGGSTSPMDIQWFSCNGDPTNNDNPQNAKLTVKMDGQFIIIAAGKATSSGARKYFDSSTGLSNIPR